METNNRKKSKKTRLYCRRLALASESGANRRETDSTRPQNTQPTRMTGA